MAEKIILYVETNDHLPTWICREF